MLIISRKKIKNFSLSILKVEKVKDKRFEVLEKRRNSLWKKRILYVQMVKL